jgi:hypothetical protein
MAKSLVGSNFNVSRKGGATIACKRHLAAANLTVDVILTPSGTRRLRLECLLTALFSAAKKMLRRTLFTILTMGIAASCCYFEG